MARTAIARLFARIHAAHQAAAQQGVPVDEIVDDRGVARPSRGQFLASLGAVATASVVPWPARAAFRFGSQPRIVIVGGGAAGITCAYRLWQRGVQATLYEANSALGGRTWTLRNFFDQGQVAEHGGEFISSEHAATRRLAAELGLTLVNVNKAEPPNVVDTNYFNGARYTMGQALRDYAAVFDPMHDALQAAGYPTTHNQHTRGGAMLDHMSVAQWVAQFVPGGTSSNIGKLLLTACVSEYGLDTDVQSALNLIYLLAFEKRGHLNLAGSDEAYHTVGGNDQYVSTMAGRLPAGTLHTDAPLVALRRNSDGSYACTFARGHTHFDVAADHVVLALPFTVLREVDFRLAGFDPTKTVAINGLGMGTNAKLHLQFTNRLWYQQGYSGAAYSDTGFQTTWEVSRAQTGTAGIIVDFPGGTGGASFHAPPHAPASTEVAMRFLSELEPVFPGITQAWNGKAFLDFWAADPWHRGSYSCYTVGQYTQFGGYERFRQGNVHFCGEHTSIAFQGYINGAVQTGENASEEVLDDLGLLRSRIAI
jgi:monoamine oxidase